MTTSVADLVQDLHADEMRGVSDVLGRYAALVRKVAGGKTLTPDEVVSAASCVFELQLPADRFDRDVSTWRTVADLEQRIATDKASKPAREDNDRERAKLAALQKAVEEQLLAMRRTVALATERVTRETQCGEIKKTNPHLFGDGVLSPNEWATARS